MLLYELWKCFDVWWLNLYVMLDELTIIRLTLKQQRLITIAIKQTCILSSLPFLIMKNNLKKASMAIRHIVFQLYIHIIWCLLILSCVLAF